VMRAVLVAVVGLCGCASSVGATDAGEDTLSNDSGGSDATGEGFCSSNSCPNGEQCCLITGRCFGLGEEASLCPRPPQDANSRLTCSSNSQCAAGEFCQGDNPALCLGLGHCQSRGNCGSCGGSNCAVCGCDGRNYTSVQMACGAGVRVNASGSGTCGTGHPSDGGGPVRGRIPCGSDSQCPSDQHCCNVTGTCTNRTCAACCRPPPPGTTFPCVTNDHCQDGEYCVGEGCGTPGGCRATENRSRCTGESNPVCGCDGRDYLNACWSAVSGSRVASTGACSR